MSSIIFLNISVNISHIDLNFQAIIHWNIPKSCCIAFVFSLRNVAYLLQLFPDAEIVQHLTPLPNIAKIQVSKDLDV